MSDVDRILALATGQTPPANGMEIHFLKVIAGEALPCGPEERNWLQIWEQQVTVGEIERLKQLNEEQAQEIYRLQEELRDIKIKLGKVSEAEWERIAAIDEVKAKAQAQIEQVNKEKERADYELRQKFAQRLAKERAGPNYRPLGVYSTTDGQ